jgi:asparagine synthetase B (glutamine-hydrolysing)
MTQGLQARPRRSAEESGAPDTEWLVRLSNDMTRLTAVGGTTATSHATTVALAGSLVSLTGPIGSVPSSPRLAADVLHAVLERGDDAFPDLRGQFALATLNQSTRQGRVVRDPLGSHPLFYTVLPDSVLFAAQPQTLLAQPGVSRALNRAAIADHLCRRPLLRHDTFFESIRRVPPGWLVELSTRGISTRRYWSPVDQTREIDFLADEEVDRFEELLTLATARAYVGRRVAILLSGGFDSVSVATVASDFAAAQGRTPPHALSMGYPDPTCDERDVQVSVAGRLGMPITLLDFGDAVGPEGLLRRSLDLNRRLAAPLFNTWLPAYLTLLDKAVQADVDTVLTGEGGDEWLGTSSFLAADLWRRGDVRGLVRLARTWKRSYHHSWLTVCRAAAWQYGLRPLVGRFCHRAAPEAWDARRTRRVIDATPDWISDDPELRTVRYDRARQNLPSADPPEGFYGREARLFLDHPLMSWMFEEQFVFAASLGLRFVHPYWDPDLVAHMYRVPPERLNEGNRTKALVRQTVDRRFPDLGFRRQRKITATTFFADLVRREAPALAEDVADFRGLASLGVIVPGKARSFVRSGWNPSQTPRDIGRAWNLVNVEVWVRGQLGLG